MLKTSQRVEDTRRMSGFHFTEGKLIKHDPMNTHGGVVNFIPRRFTRWTEGWVCHRAGLDAVRTIQIVRPCRESNPGSSVTQPVA
jgi:hypothetical protein